jgi:hypothetical protein
MRNYWLKIIAASIGIFAVGMLLIGGFRSLKSKVTHTLDSSDPIPIPLIGLIPFRLDDAKLGSVSRVEFLRSDPEHISGVRVVVKLADSVTPDRLRACELAIDDVEINDRTTFRCQVPADSGRGQLEPFGVVAIRGTGDTFPLLLPTRTVNDLRQTTIRFDKNGLHIEGPQNQAAAAREARRDSIREALDSRIDALSDSIDALKDQASELEDSSTSLGAAQRRQVQHSADSVRSLMRAMVDRMKLNEAKMKALDSMSGLSPAQIDSLSKLGSRIEDSVRLVVARELQRAHVEVERARAQTTRVEGPPTAPPPPAKPR